jgi:hypothetical protein
MMALLKPLKILLLVGIAAFAAMLLYGYARNHPEDVPWTSLDLSRPVGAFTGRKLAALVGEKAQCRALLHAAGVGFTNLARRSDGPQCGYDDAVRLSIEGSLDVAYRPAGLGISCPVAAALALWEWHVVQPAALRHFGRKVATIEHFGSYNCRRLYGRSEGAWSEHAHANAVDVAAFRLTDGRRISVAGDWTGSAGHRREAAFLHDVRDGACPLFATVLSPDYNKAHHDHLHLDQAGRGALGWRACR